MAHRRTTLSDIWSHHGYVFLYQVHDSWPYLPTKTIGLPGAEAQTTVPLSLRGLSPSAGDPPERDHDLVTTEPSSTFLNQVLLHHSSAGAVNHSRP